MTSLRQIAANRRNAVKSTGPKTEAGKQQSRRNAVRHGLTAETVVDVLEDPEDYKAFERAVTADFDVQTAVERELVLRLASLLWRLRRATAIETGLLQIPGDIDREPGEANITDPPPLEHVLNIQPNGERSCSIRNNYQLVPQGNGGETAENAARPESKFNSIACRFSQLANLENGGFERLGRYETALWRQAYQVIFILDVLRRQNLDVKWLPRPSRYSARFRLPRSIFSKP
jgi:hypothetical protein